MKLVVKTSCCLLTLCWLSLFNQIAVAAQIPDSDAIAQLPADKRCDIKPTVRWKINAIFDETAPDTIWIHRLANWLHIDTREVALNNEIAFLSICALDQKQLAELERYLRELNYLRDARVTVEATDDKQQRIMVETWDNWTMMPTLDFGRKGGKNRFSFGIQDRNFLGYGVDAEIKYFSNAQRNGYKIKINAPLYFKQNSYVHLAYVNSDDGFQKAVEFTKPFISLNSRIAGTIGYNTETRVDTIFQNGDEAYAFAHDITQAYASVGFSSGVHEHKVWRYTLAIDKSQHVFSQPTADIPLSDRDQLITWIGYQYIDDQYKKVTNLYLIDKIEDINFGWQHQGKIGWVKDYLATGGQWAWQWQANKATELNEQWVHIFTVETSGLHYQQRPDPWLINAASSLFYRVNDDWGWYHHLEFTRTKNQYSDQPITLGGDNGVRGYPLQYQHGQNQLVMNTELRYYPHISIYKLFDVGAVAFIDVGKSTGASILTNNDNGLMKSIGVGARFYSNRASDQNVVHVDLARPMSQDDAVNQWELRIEVQHQF
jgi:hypothetical protein